MIASMTTSDLQTLVRFDEYAVTPKYRQLMHAIIKEIENGKLCKNDSLPSVNALSYEFDICWQTAKKGNEQLKSQGIIGSVPGKGYYVKTATLEPTSRVLLLFNNLSAHEKIIYDAIVKTLADQAIVDLYVYNNDLTFFRKLLDNCQGEYDYYVILPHFIEGYDTAHDPINTIPKEKLILLDKIIPGVTDDFAAVYENFEEDIYAALQQSLKQLEKYHTIKIVYPENDFYPKEILKGFTSFCKDYAFNYKVVHDLHRESFSAGEVYINLADDELITLIECMIPTKLTIGKEVGIISYNETPLKKIILNGITTISTDFEMMGIETARMITEKSRRKIRVPFTLNLRASL